MSDYSDIRSDGGMDPRAKYERERAQQYEMAFDAKLGGQLRDEGMARAADKAEREDDGWQDAATAALRSFDPGRPFMAEDFREIAYAEGLPHPASERAWGAVFMRAKREGWLREAGFGLTKTPGQHRCPGRLWTKT